MSGNDGPMTFEEIAQELGTSKQYVQRVFAEALPKLAKHLYVLTGEHHTVTLARLIAYDRQIGASLVAAAKNQGCGRARMKRAKRAA